MRVQVENIGYLALVNCLSECVHENNYKTIPSHVDYQHVDYSRFVCIYYTTEVGQCPSEDYK